MHETALHIHNIMFKPKSNGFCTSICSVLRICEIESYKVCRTAVRLHHQTVGPQAEVRSPGREGAAGYGGTPPTFGKAADFLKLNPGPVSPFVL